MMYERHDGSQKMGGIQQKIRVRILVVSKSWSTNAEVNARSDGEK